MCSNKTWPLLWQRALSRWYWPNYSAFIRSRQSVTGVPRKCLDADVYDRMRKTKKHSVVLACILAWLRHFAWMKELVFFFAWNEACFADARWQWLLTLDWGHVTSWRYMEFVTTWEFSRSLERCFVAVGGICCREMLVGGTAAVQVRDPCTLTILYNCSLLGAVVLLLV